MTEEAKKKYPKLDATLKRISDEIRQARSTGKRFAYKKPLKALYKLAYGWSEEKCLNSRIKRVAGLRDIGVRENANPFSVLVRAVLGPNADRKTVSRWSLQLTSALEDEVEPDDLEGYI
jgi:hypothetical protein